MSVLQREVMEGLMEWFRENARAMPWRGIEDPYRIWISEVMLQQTQVNTVIPYYLRWMDRFPDVISLAEASYEAVMKCWEGLGYYGRARNLLAAARIITGEHGGIFPRKSTEWLKLPGVGPYIAAAVGSIAFNEPTGVVDGNTIRVLTRLFGIEDDASKPALKSRIGRLIETGYYDFEPRWVNQAWMEMGALQCTRFPACERCPLRSHCRAAAENRVEGIPNLPKRKRVPQRRGIAYIIEKNNDVLLVRRPPYGLLNHLWEPPNVMLDTETRHVFETRHGIRVLNETGKETSHQYSHFKVTFSIFTARLEKRWISDFWTDHRWVPPNSLDELARPQVHIKAFKLAGYR